MTAMPTPGSTLLNDLARRGIELQAPGDRLRYRSRSAMPPDLAARLRIHKADLLAILARAAIDAIRPDPATESPQDGRDARQRLRHARMRQDGSAISAGTPPTIAELAAARPGWIPASWGIRLRQLAHVCQDVSPARACELREAVRLLGDPEPVPDLT